MARISYIKFRLDNWALWRIRECSGGLGYASCSVLLNEPVDGHRELMATVSDCDAELTNSAVESLRPARLHLYTTLQLIYIQNTGVKLAARRTGCAESTIKAHLDHADRALAAWFNEHAEKNRSFTT